MDSIATVLLTLSKMVITGLGFYVFIDGMTIETDVQKPEYWLNITSIVLLVVAEMLYTYRLVIAGLMVFQFPPGNIEQIEKIQFKGLDYYSRGGDLSAGMILYWVNLIGGPAKAALVADLCAGLAMGFAQKWEYLSPLVLMWAPAAGVEIGLFSFQPFMDLPFIDWAKLFGVEPAELYYNPK